MEPLFSSFDPLLNKQSQTILVFDIDSTIFNVSPRNQGILDLFTSIYSRKFPLLQEPELKIELHYKDWGLRPYLKALEINCSAKPEQKSMLIKEAKSFWNRHFFTGTFLSCDRPYPGVLSLIKFLSTIPLFEIYYLTGRDFTRMRKATLEQLKSWRLPLEKDGSLITKPSKNLYDNFYKEKELKRLIHQNPHKTIYFFDNEPSVFKSCLFPEEKKYHPIFIESTHSERSLPDKNWSKLNVKNYPRLLNYLIKGV